MSAVSSTKRSKEPGFLKTFPSDLDDASVQKLLMEIKTGDPAYKDFTTRDMKLLAQLISALRFEPGDKIISRGEEASFVGIVLKGTFASVLDDRLHVALRKGEMIGELEFFESGSIRKADLVAATQGVLGVLTFEDVKLIGLTSIDLHSHIMRLLSVSSIKKLRQSTQTGGGTGTTPKVRSRRTSFSTRPGEGLSLQTNLRDGGSPSPSPAASVTSSGSPMLSPLQPLRDLPPGDEPKIARIDSAEDVILASVPVASATSPNPSQVEDDIAVAAAVAALKDDDTGTTPMKALRRSTAAGGAAAPAEADGLELLFRYRMKKNPAIKPRRIEADVLGLVDQSMAKEGHTTFPPLPAGAGLPLNSRGSFSSAAGAGPNGLVAGVAGTAAQAQDRLPAPSGVSMSSQAATDKNNYNYVLYALRNKVAKQEDLLSEREAALANRETELTVLREELLKEQTRVRELQDKCNGYASALKTAEEKATKFENELSATRQELQKRTHALEHSESERRSLLDQTSLTISTMHAKLVEHGAILGEGMGEGVLGGAALQPTLAKDTSSSSNQAKGINKFLQSAGSLPASMQQSSGDAHSSASTSGKMSRNASNASIGESSGKHTSKYTSSSYGAQNHHPSSHHHSHHQGAQSHREKQTLLLGPNSSALVLGDNLSDYASQYESMIAKLKVGASLRESERQLIAMHKWKARAQEFANTWDLERTRLKDRIKSGLFEVEQLKTQKDSYKILLKVVTVKLFMQHSHLRKQMKEVYRKIVELTTDILIEQKFTGGLKGIPVTGSASSSVQTENAEELLVRIQQKLNERPWGGSSLRGRPPQLKALVESVDDELGRLITANSDILASKKQWQETAESFFQRNIELTQSVSGHDVTLNERNATVRQLEKRLGESEAHIASLERQVSQLEANHKSKLSELQSTRAANAGEVRARKQEVESLFEKHVSLQRKLREHDLVLVDLEKKETKLHERNNALLEEQRKLLSAIQQAKEIEAQIQRGNGQAYALQIAAQNAAQMQSRRSLGATSSASLLGPLIGSPRINRASASATSFVSFNNYTGQPQAAPLQQQGQYAGTMGFQNTMPLPQPGMQYQFSQGSFSGQQSSGSFAPMLSASPSIAGNGVTSGPPVLATIRARPQPAWIANQLTPEQWAAISSLPSNLQPHTARPPPSIQPPLVQRRKGSSSARDRGVDRAETKQQAHAAKLALHSAMQRESLDRALFKAAKAGLGRGLGSGSSKQIKPARTMKPSALTGSTLESSAGGQEPQQQEHKEDSAPTPPPQPLQTPSLKEMMNLPQ